MELDVVQWHMVGIQHAEIKDTYNEMVECTWL